MTDVLQDVTDEELARRAQAGSSECFSELVRRFDRPVYSFLVVRSGNASDARELAQETFLRAWRKLRYFDADRRFSTWIFTLARRTAIGHFRRARPRPVGEAALAEVADESDPSRGASRREQHGRLWALAGRVLNEEQRSALWLRYGEDLPVHEVARVLGRRESTVRVQLFRARERLAGHLAREEAPQRGDGRRARGGSHARPESCRLETPMTKPLAGGARGEA